MKRGKLREAVLLSLLLTNVCRWGGAAEYNTTITGTETEYDSIKQTNGTNVKYTFTGENTIKDNAGSDAFQPVKVTDKIVTIDIGDKLTLIGKGNGVSPALSGNILADTTNGSLTFTGGTLEIKDLTEYPKSNYTVHANNGGSIVFDNKETDIGVGNLTQSSFGIRVWGEDSKVIFTENADKLKLNSAIGISVNNGGSFTFNNTDGEILIENNPEDRTRDTGGTGVEVSDGSLTLKGKKTVIRTTNADGTAGGAAVSVVENDKNNLLNFAADQTVLTGNFGVYVDGSIVDPDANVQTTINFSGDTEITAYNKGRNEYINCVAVSALYTGAKINFDKQVVLKAVTDNAYGGYNAAGAMIESGSVLKAKQGLQVEVQATGNRAIGLDAYGTGSLIDVTGKTTVKASSSSGEIRGVQGWSGAEVKLDGALEAETTSDSGAVTGLWSWDGGQVDITGAAKIQAVSSRSIAIGINSNNSGSVAGTEHALTQIGGDASIKASGAGNTIGISAFSNGDVAIEGKAEVTAVSSAGSVLGINANSGGKVTVAKAAGILAQSNKGDAYAIQSWNSSAAVFQETAQIVVDTGGSNAKGIYAGNGGQVNFAKDVIFKVGGLENSNKTAYYVRAITAMQNADIKINGDAVLSVSGVDTIGLDVSDSSKITVGGKYSVVADSTTGGAQGMGVSASEIKLGSDCTIVAGSKGDKNVYGINGNSSSKIDVAGMTVISAVADSFYSNVYGIQGWNSTVVDLQKETQIVIDTNGGDAKGIYAWNGTNVNFGNDAIIQIGGLEGSDKNSGYARAITAMKNSEVKISGDAIFAVSGEDAIGLDVSDNSKITVDGMYTAAVQASAAGAKGIGVSGSEIRLGSDCAVTVSSEGNGAVFGIEATGGSRVTLAGSALIKASGLNEVIGVSSDAGTVEFAGDAVIITTEAGKTRAVGNQGIGVSALNSGKVDLKKGLILDNKGQSYGLKAEGSGSNIAVNSSGSGDVYLTGDITALKEGLLELDLTTDRSYYEGAATAVTDGRINMKLRNGAAWKVTGNSNLTELDLGNDAVVDIEQAAGYQTLQTGKLTGGSGTFVLGTDIAAGQNDKVFIDGGSSGGHYKILVKDIAKRSGDNLHMLLVDDASGLHDFTAQDLYNGGIYFYKADIANEIDSGTKWYLQRLYINATEDAKSLLQTADSLYSSWVMGSDLLQGRLCELQEAPAESGLWTRINRGKLRGAAFKNNYQNYQIGYDAAFKDSAGSSMNDWLGGAAFEYAKGNTSYGNGNGEQHTAALMLYGSKHSQSGDRLDIVLKHGQIQGDLDTFGLAADRSNYKSRATALSMEYGKRLQCERGVYLEPQAQFMVSHINGNACTTDNGIKAEMEGINSAVGRLGLELGKRYDRGSIYAKASLLHEFAGRADTLLTSGQETLRDSRDYSGSWWELNLGGELELSKNNDLYFDVARSFGGSFQKQWQINGGIRFSF